LEHPRREIQNEARSCGPTNTCGTGADWREAAASQRFVVHLLNQRERSKARMECDGAIAFSGFSKAKTELDKTIAAIREREGRPPMPRWTLHDLRRTARSLMSRAKVPTDHAERVLGHVIGGVRETYDRYEYLDEKRHALEQLARLVDWIVHRRIISVRLKRVERGVVANA
jgi:integrase